MQKFRQWMIALGLVFTTSTTYILSSASQSIPVRSDYETKANFLLNFLKFIEIPEQEDREEDVYRIGVVGDSSVMRFIRRTLEDKRIDGLPIVVCSIASDEDLAKLCHLVFVPGNYTESSNKLLRAVQNEPVVLVGESPAFARKYGLVGFVERNGQIRFEINPYRAKVTGISVSGKIASLAEIVEDSK